MRYRPAVVRSRPDRQIETPLGRRFAAADAAFWLVAVLIAGVGLIGAGGVASAEPTADDWYRLRVCESGNNYAINTGNGYYGAYQFDLGTWRSVGGTGYPNQASPATQDALALTLYRQRGWSPWTCATRSCAAGAAGRCCGAAGTGHPRRRLDRLTSPSSADCPLRRWVGGRPANRGTSIQVHHLPQLSLGIRSPPTSPGPMSMRRSVWVATMVHRNRSSCTGGRNSVCAVRHRGRSGLNTAAWLPDGHCAGAHHRLPSGNWRAGHRIHGFDRRLGLRPEPVVGNHSGALLRRRSVLLDHCERVPP